MGARGITPTSTCDLNANRFRKSSCSREPLHKNGPRMHPTQTSCWHQDLKPSTPPITMTRTSSKPPNPPKAKDPRQSQDQLYTVAVSNVANCVPHFEFTETATGQMAFAKYNRGFQGLRFESEIYQRFRNVGDILVAINTTSVVNMPSQNVRSLIDSCFMVDGQSIFVMKESKHKPSSTTITSSSASIRPSVSTQSRVSSNSSHPPSHSTQPLTAAAQSLRKALETGIANDQQTVKKLQKDYATQLTAKKRIASTIAVTQTNLAQLRLQVRQAETRIAQLSQKEKEKSKACDQLQEELQALTSGLSNKKRSLAEVSSTRQVEASASRGAQIVSQVSAEETQNTNQSTHAVNNRVSGSHRTPARIPQLVTVPNENDDVQLIESSSSSHPSKCPITAQTMKNPVRNKVCGHVYSREGIDKLLKLTRQRKKSRSAAAHCPCPIAGCKNQKVSQAQLCAVVLGAPSTVVDRPLQQQDKKQRVLVDLT